MSNFLTSSPDLHSKAMGILHSKLTAIYVGGVKYYFLKLSLNLLRRSALKCATPRRLRR